MIIPPAIKLILAGTLTASIVCGPLLSSSHAQKQTPKQDSKKEPPGPSSSCTRDSALEILHQQIDATRTFTDQVQHITILIGAADLLWRYEQKKARATFAESFELAKQNYKEAGDEPRKAGAFAVESVPDQRYKVIKAIAKRDPSWARTLTDEMLKDEAATANEKAKNLSTGTSAGEKLLDIADALLTTDKATALNFATSSLRYPATLFLSAFFYKLSAVDRAAADQFYQQALAAYANAPMERFLYLSSYPFGNDREAGEMPGYTIYLVPSGFTPSPILQRMFVANILRRAQQFTQAPAEPQRGSLSDTGQAWLALTRLDKQIQQSLPDLAPAVEQARGELFAQLPQNSQSRIGELSRDRDVPKQSFDEQVEAAERNPNVDRRDQQLTIAVMRASGTEDLERALSVVGKISDSAVRAQLLNWLYFDRTLRAIKDQKLREGHDLAAKVDELDQRAYLYSRLAEESLKQNMDQTQAREMLEEVLAAAAKAPATSVTARTLLGTAYLYARIDLNRAIGVLGDAVKVINKLEQPDFPQYVMRKIEGKTFGSYASFQTPGFSPENAFREISKVDYDGTLNQASNFADRSLRALTIMATVETCLEKNRK
jgi:hypothetical protein